MARKSPFVRGGTRPNSDPSLGSGTSTPSGPLQDLIEIGQITLKRMDLN